MKNVYMMLLDAGLLTACQPAAKMDVSGMLNGIESDTLLVNHRPVGEGEAQLDTVPMQNGQFAFNVGDSVLKQVYIYAKPSGNGAISMQALGLILLPGRPVTVSGTLEDYRLGGDAFYEACNELNDQLRPCILKLDSLREVCMQMEKDGIPSDSIRKAYTPSREFLDRMQDLRCDFIRSHADQEVAVYALSCDLSMQKVGEMLDVVAEPVRTGIMASLYRQVKEGYDKEMERRAAAERVKEGNPAPDFTLKDLKGNDFTLSSLRGKYVVLDFWGSWCGWCIKGVPDMKKAYAKHKAKVEFVGIDCRDTEEKWRKAVAEHDMPWLHVRNEGKPDVSVLYAVRGYPTKIVLSPEGTILKIVVGEDPEFYSYLDELLNS